MVTNAISISTLSWLIHLKSRQKLNKLKPHLSGLFFCAFWGKLDFTKKLKTRFFPLKLVTTSVTRKFVHPASSGYFLSFWEANKNPYFKQKGSWGYWLEFMLYEVVCKTMFLSLRINFHEEGKIMFLKKVQEVRKHAENVRLEDFTLVRWLFRRNFLCTLVVRKDLAKKSGWKIVHNFFHLARWSDCADPEQNVTHENSSGGAKSNTSPNLLRTLFHVTEVVLRCKLNSFRPNYTCSSATLESMTT